MLNENEVLETPKAPIVAFSRSLEIENSNNISSLKKFAEFFVRFCFSRFGLVFLVLIYLTMGGILFSVIESRYEPRQQEKVQRKHSIGMENIRRIVDDEFNWILNNSFELRYGLWRGISSRLDEKTDNGWRVNVHAQRFDELIDKEMQRMKNEQEKLLDKEDFSHRTNFQGRWSFSTAALFSATIITTVGYGNITPRSIWGKLVTCLYAAIGIPIMIMYINNTADLLAFIFVKNYSYAENIFQRRVHRSTRLALQSDLRLISNVPIAVVVALLFLYLFAGAFLFSHWEGWSYVDGAYFSFITFSTIGLGDLVPGKGILSENKNGKTILCIIYLLFGLVLTAMCFKLMQDDLFALKRRIYERLGLDKFEPNNIY